MSTELQDRPLDGDTRPVVGLDRAAMRGEPRRTSVARPRASWMARFGGFVLVVLALLGSVTLAGRMISLPDLNPFSHLFGAKTTDRTQPPVLEAVRDLSEYDAAEGTFQVVIDLQHGHHHIPGFVAGDRTLYLAIGQVDASVDFGALDAQSVTVAQDGAVRITLPEPTLGTAHLDPSQSRVYSHDRGLFDRVGSAFGNGGADDQRQLDALAQTKITKAAKATDLTHRAETNTRSMLVQLLGALGHDEVTVVFAG